MTVDCYTCSELITNSTTAFMIDYPLKMCSESRPQILGNNVLSRKRYVQYGRSCNGRLIGSWNSTITTGAPSNLYS